MSQTRQINPKNHANSTDILALRRVADVETLRQAWRRIKGNAGMPGVDGETIARFSAGLENNLRELNRTLLAGQYQPCPVRRIWRPKEDGKLRPISILTLRDRIVQRAAHDVLSPAYERKFLPCSVGYRPGLGITDAIRRIEGFRDKGQTWVVDGDIESCFERLDHRLLLDILARDVRDAGLLELVERWLNAEIFNDIRPTTHRQPGTGTPQGGALSPLLSNIYLHEFDRAMSHAGLSLTRYADDWVIQSRDTSSAHKARERAESELGKLGLAINPHKTSITSFDKGFCFLGVFFLRNEHFVLAPGSSLKHGIPQAVRSGR